MTGIDTAALRAAAEDAEQAAYAVSVSLHPTTVRALCDGYDEAQRLRARTFADYATERYQAERDAARQALAEAEAEAARLRGEVEFLAPLEGRGPMTTIDTAALRALIEACEGADQTYLTIRQRRLSKALDFDTVRTLCDAYDEAARLRAEVQEFRSLRVPLGAVERRTIKDLADQRDAARQALADLVADLRALCDDPKQPGDAVWTDDLRAVIDRHAPGCTAHLPATPTTED